MKSGIELIAEERQRQIEQEGFDSENDADYKKDELAKAAACYAFAPAMKDEVRFGDDVPKGMWPWKAKWWKPTPDNRIKEL